MKHIRRPSRLCANLVPAKWGEILQHVHDGVIEHDLFPSFAAWLADVEQIFREGRFTVDGAFLNFWPEVNRNDGS